MKVSIYDYEEYPVYGIDPNPLHDDVEIREGFFQEYEEALSRWEAIQKEIGTLKDLLVVRYEIRSKQEEHEGEIRRLRDEELKIYGEIAHRLGEEDNAK